MKTTSSFRQRDTHLDIISFILVCYMMSLHFFATVGEKDTVDFLNRLIPFFMPWFFFKGGMYFSSGPLTKAYVWGSIKRLLIPNACFVIYGFILTCLTPEHQVLTWRNQMIEIFILGLTRVNGALWYLVALFCIRLICRWTCHSWRSCIVVISVACSMLVLHYHGFLTHLCWGLPLRIAHGMVFFVAGILLRQWQYHRYVLWTALGVTMLGYICLPSYVTAYNNDLQWGNYYLFFPLSIAGIIATNGISRYIPQPSVLVGLGQNSLFMLCAHLPLVKFFHGILLKTCTIEGTMVHAIAVAGLSILCMALLFPILKYTPLKCCIGE